MAKTVFARKKIKELSGQKVFAVLGALDAPFMWFSKNFFVCNSPAYASNRNCKYKKPDNLNCYSHI